MSYRRGLPVMANPNPSDYAFAQLRLLQGEMNWIPLLNHWYPIPQQCVNLTVGR